MFPTLSIHTNLESVLPHTDKIWMTIHFCQYFLESAATSATFCPLIVHMARLSISVYFWNWLPIQLSTSSCHHPPFTVEMRQHTPACSTCYCHAPNKQTFTTLHM